MYLRVWARELRVPIVSVDYSLAPEAPFPRALEECFFAYAWVLKNAGKLGTTAEFVCLAGDSAGKAINYWVFYLTTFISQTLWFSKVFAMLFCTFSYLLTKH